MIYESVQTQRCFHFTLNSTHTLHTHYTHTHTQERDTAEDKFGDFSGDWIWNTRRVSDSEGEVKTWRGREGKNRCVMDETSDVWQLKKLTSLQVWPGHVKVETKGDRERRRTDTNSDDDWQWIPLQLFSIQLTLIKLISYYTGAKFRPVGHIWALV